MSRKNESGSAMSSTPRRLFSWVAIPLLMAVPLALFMGYAALQHNPQEEFCAYVAHGASANYSVQGEGCNIKWGELSLVFASWLLAQTVILTVARAVLSSFRGK
jgi:hypothetical protein